MEEKKARPITAIIYRFCDWRCVISCYPQQRWGVTDKGSTVMLERRNFTMELPREEFERNWKVVE